MVLALEVDDAFATVTVSRNDNASVLRLKKFNNYNDALEYYSEQYSNLKIVEEYETMKVAFKMLGLM